MAETFEIACSVNTQEIKSISPPSEVTKKSTGRKSFSNRRSSCFDSIGLYFSVEIHACGV